MNKLKINRKYWRSGGTGPHATGKGETLLKNDQNFKCCLGFAMEKCGNMFIKGVAAPHCLPKPTKESYPFITEKSEGTPLSKKAIRINDDYNTPPSLKEELLIDLFNDHGIALNFYGKYSKK